MTNEAMDKTHSMTDYT